MKRKNATRNALFTSIISLLLCVSMLVSTSFAWFTDEVVSGTNMIAAGNLDVELYHSNKVDTNEQVKIDTVLFDDVKLWEPGAVAWENLTVINKGTLALKYVLAVNFTNENTVDGYGLSQALKIAVVDNAITETDREKLIASIESDAWQSLEDFSKSGDLLNQNDRKTYGFVMYWQPSENDNNWNVNNDKVTSNGDILHIDLGVKLFATQQMNESDSFGSDYDEGAAWTDGMGTNPEQPEIPATVGLYESLKKLDDLPIASSDMTEAQLRGLILDYMRLQLTFRWTPTESFNLSASDTISKDGWYGGMLYKSGKLSNLYNVAEHLLEDDRVDIDNVDEICNQGSASPFWAWSRVSDTIKFTGTSTVTPSYGCVPVGKYTLPAIQDFFNDGFNTANFAAEKVGEQNMMESYAMLQPADGVVRYVATTGHILMISGYPNVVYKEDGTIDPDQSTILVMDQTSARNNATLEDGTAIVVQGIVDKEYTFKELYDAGYLGFTIPEFAGQDDVEDASLTTNYNLDKANYANVAEMPLTSNYSISDIRVTVTTSSGETVYTNRVPTLKMNVRSTTVGSVATSALNAYADQGMTVTVSCRMGNGAEVTAWSGSLVSEKQDFDPGTAPDSDVNVIRPEEYGPDAPVVETNGSYKLLTWEAINEIPVATNDMNEDELRQIVLDFMRLQLSFRWTPNANLSYVNNGKNVTLAAGATFGGLPYIGSHFSNIYNVVDYLDPDTGVLDVATLGNGFADQMGNQCSSSAYWAWSRVVNTLKYEGTSSALPENGCVSVGDYVIPDTIENFHTQGIATNNICKDNGDQTMYESYAKLEPADGLVGYSGTAGHVVMVASEPKIVRDENGQIDGNKSSLTILEQQPNWRSKNTEYGPMAVQGGIDIEWTFKALFASGYLPFTFAEFLGTDPVEAAVVTSNCEAGSVTYVDLQNMQLQSNYPISDVSIEVLDPAGNVLYSDRVPTLQLNVRVTTLGEDVAKYAINDYADDGSNTVRVSCRVGNGEKITAYTGTLQHSDQKPPMEPYQYLTWDVINSIPVADSDMTEAQLRQICLDYMRLQLSFLWTPDEQLTCSTGSGPKTLAANELRGGMVHSANHYNNIYNIVDCLKPDGTLDVSENGTKAAQYIRTHKSCGAYWAWARVSDTLGFSNELDVLWADGIERLGNYSVGEYTSLSGQNTSVEICTINGEQKMYEAYALLEPADGIVARTTVSTMGMITANPTVVYNADGTIDGEQSTITYMAKDANTKSYSVEAGTALIEANMSVSATFAKLYKSGFLPFTIPELSDPSSVQAANVTVIYEDTSATYADLQAMQVTSNYPISDVSIEVKAADGTVLHTAKEVMSKTSIRSHTVGETLAPAALEDKAGEGVIVTVYCRVSTGERLKAYEGELAKTATPEPEPEPTPDPDKPVVEPSMELYQTLTWDVINSIPVANSKMTEAQLRQICLDYMRLQTTFLWSPNKEFEAHNGSRYVTYAANDLRCGMLHHGSKYGNIYNLLDYMTADGVLDVAKYGTKVADPIRTNMVNGTYWAWSRVSANLNYVDAERVFSAGGVEKVGSYNFDTTKPFVRSNKSNSNPTSTICTSNGEMTMYAAYAELKPADGIVYCTTGSNLAMITTYPTVVYNGDSIDGEKSTVTYMEKVAGEQTATIPSGGTAKINANVSVTKTFAQLYSAGYLPFTLPEFSNASSVKVANVTVSNKDTSAAYGTSVTCADLQAMKLTSNYPISDVRIEVKSGNEVVHAAKTAMNVGIREYVLDTTKLAPATLADKAGDGVTVKVYCRVSTGEEIPVYSGNLVAQ